MGVGSIGSFFRDVEHVYIMLETAKEGMIAMYPSLQNFGATV